MYYSVVIVVLAQSFYASGWVINNIDVEALTKNKLNKFEKLNNSINYLSEENSDVQPKFTFIYPGTKWCGAGDIANNFNDLGSEWRTDMCCREHDYCPEFIPAGENRHNLTNEAFYTRLTCECDETFRKCLLASNSNTADSIGMFYFNALGTKCYKKEYPKGKCVKKGGWLNKKCLLYTYDKSFEKVYQWFDVNNYR